jgi:fatty-acyl-CoA synthase
MPQAYSTCLLNMSMHTSKRTTPDRLSHVAAEADAEFLDWTVGDLLRDAVRRNADRLALIVPASSDGRPERRWTYQQIEAEADKTAHALLARFAPGDRVATCTCGSAEVIFLHLGAALAGVVLVTLNPANRAAELQYLLAQAEVRGLFTDRMFRQLDNAAVVASLQASLPALETVVYFDQWSDFQRSARASPLPAVAAAAPAMILYTSGTTGKPKGAVLKHAGIVNNARLAAARLELPDASVWLNMLPMFHIGGSVTMTLGCIANLGTQVLLPDFSAEAMLDALERYAVRVTMAVPTMLLGALQSAQFAATDLSKLEIVVTGGTVVAPELVRAVKTRFGAEVMVLFGQTEAGGTMCLTRRGDELDQITRSVGTPLPLSELKIILTDTGDIAPIGFIGEICVKTRCAMLEYFRMPDKTREALDSEGWVHTGDLGLMRPDGYLQVTGRLKDMIIRGGENIYPREVEDVLAEHTAVSQAAVFGIADDKWGEQVAAAIVLKAGQATSGAALAEYLLTRIARHKVPKVWHFVDSLPINASGKIQKFLLRDQYGSD